MRACRASAPGKVVLTGEYAVLAGAPAVTMAVNRRARVAVEPDDGDGWRLDTPGFRPGTLRFGFEDGRLAWRAAGGVALVEKALSGRCLPAGGTMTLDSAALHDAGSGRKLGFGSSAAVCVALVAALSAMDGYSNAGACDEDVYARSMAVHGSLQAGRGSGVDVATAFCGGLIAYRMSGTPEPLDWPEGLRVALFWSGQPARTTDRLESVEAAAGGSDALEALARSASEAEGAWRAGHAAALLETLRDYRRALEEFDRRLSVGVFAAGHDRLAAAVAGRRDVVYKPCGAGGGDVGAAFAVSEAALDAVADAATALGFRRLHAERDDDGVRVGATDA